MVLWRRVAAGKVETQLIVGEFHPKAYPKAAQEEGRFDAPNAYKVIATLDLDGDSKMEIVVHSDYYEGGETTIYRCDPKKVEALLSVACGVGAPRLCPGSGANCYDRDAPGCQSLPRDLLLCELCLSNVPNRF
jgi:hypothetical protein